TDRVCAGERLRGQHSSGADTVGVQFAAGDIAGTIRCESPNSCENGRAAAIPLESAECKCVIAIQLGVVHTGAGLSLSVRTKKQSETQQQHSIQLAHLSSVGWLGDGFCRFQNKLPMTEARGASAPCFQIRVMETAGTRSTWNSREKCCAFQTFVLRGRLRSSAHARSLIIHPFLP